MADAVYWVEASARPTRPPASRLAAAPIDVGPVLREQLFDKVPTVVMTSATLAVGERGSFDFFKSRDRADAGRNALPGQPVRLPPPGRADRCSTGMPDPAAEQGRYEQQCVAMIRRYVARTDGRAFVLFTSYEMMRRVAAAAGRPGWPSRTWRCYSQADGMPRTQMLERFKAQSAGGAVRHRQLLAGGRRAGRRAAERDHHPAAVQRARPPAARGPAGGDPRRAAAIPFRDYQLPEAILKLKQGFGRLIRTQRDTGMVVILDPRVRTQALRPDVPRLAAGLPARGRSGGRRVGRAASGAARPARSCRPRYAGSNGGPLTGLPADLQ